MLAFRRMACQAMLDRLQLISPECLPGAKLTWKHWPRQRYTPALFVFFPFTPSLLGSYRGKLVHHGSKPVDNASRLGLAVAATILALAGGCVSGG